MYVPAHFAANPDAVQELLARPGASNLVTVTAQGLLATLVPFLYDPSIGEHRSEERRVGKECPV